MHDRLVKAKHEWTKDGVNIVTDRFAPRDRLLIFQTELKASAQALENGEDPQRVAAQMRYTLRLVGEGQA